METNNKEYYLVSVEKWDNPSIGVLCLRAIYSNGIKQIGRKFNYKQVIPTVIYDNEN